MFANSSRHLLRVSLLSVLIRIATNFTVTKLSSFDSSFAELNTTHGIPSVYHLIAALENLLEFNFGHKHNQHSIKVQCLISSCSFSLDHLEPNSAKHGSFHDFPKQPNLMGRFQLFTSFSRIKL